ncbi:hypothetical protein BDR22DRAFT_885478 [Usnea florida]
MASNSPIAITIVPRKKKASHPSHHVGSPPTDEHRHRKADTEPPGMESTIDSVDSFEAEDQQLDRRLQDLEERSQAADRHLQALAEREQAADWITVRLETAQRLATQLEAEGKFNDAATVLEKALDDGQGLRKVVDEYKRHVVGSE